MGQPIEITRTDLSAAELRAFAVRSGDGAVVRRLLATALLLQGQSREAAAVSGGMTRQTLRDLPARSHSCLREAGFGRRR